MQFKLDCVKFIILLVFLLKTINGEVYIRLSVNAQLLDPDHIERLSVEFGINGTTTHELCSQNICQTNKSYIGSFYVRTTGLLAQNMRNLTASNPASGGGSDAYSANIEGTYDDNWSVTSITVIASGLAAPSTLCTFNNFNLDDKLTSKSITRKCIDVSFVLSRQNSLPYGWEVPLTSLTSSPSRTASRSPSITPSKSSSYSASKSLSSSISRTPSKSTTPSKTNSPSISFSPSKTPSSSITATPSPSPPTCGIEATVPEALQETGLQIFCDRETQTWVVNGSFTLNSTLDTSQPVEVLGNLTLTDSSMLVLTNPKGLIVRGCVLLNGSLVVTLETEFEGNITLKDIITWNCSLQEKNQTFDSISVQFSEENECIDSTPNSEYGSHSLSVIVSGRKNKDGSCLEEDSSVDIIIGALVGGIVGGVFVLAIVVTIILLVVVYFVRKKTVEKFGDNDDL